MALATPTLCALPTEPLILILSYLIPVDLAHLRLTCSALRAQLDHLGARKSVDEKRNTDVIQCTFRVRCWPQLGMERLDMVEHPYGLHKIATNYAGGSCMIMSILDETYCRYLYIDSGMAKYLLSTCVSNRLDIWILRSVKPLRVQEYLKEWLKHRYSGSHLFITIGNTPSICRSITDIWDAYYGGYQYMFAPEVVQLLTSW